VKKPPTPPRPDAIRQPQTGFGWLDARLLRDRWLPDLGADAVAVLAFLALAADRNGVSFYARDRMAVELGIDVPRLDKALDRLREVGLIAHRPWRRGRRDGVWQLLDVPVSQVPERKPGQATIGDVLLDLGFKPPTQNRES
jgi:hypothetical protein